MADPSLYLIDYGILGRGKDIFLELPCMISILEDSFEYKEKEWKKSALQVFPNLTSELFSRKLDQICKAAYLFYVPFHLNVQALVHKKNEDKSNDLLILYEFDKMDISLEQLIQQRKNENHPFSEQEIWELLYVLIDSMYMSSRLTYEYLDISPCNIFYSPGSSCKFYIANFGLQVHKKFEKYYHCTQDSFYTKKGKEPRTIDMFVRSFMFQIGMIALHMATLENPNDLYNEIYGSDQKKINQDLVQKRLVQCSINFSEVFFQLLQRLLTTREEKRLDLEKLLNPSPNELTLPRKIHFYQGKLPDAEMFCGFVQNSENENEKIPHGVGDIFTDMKQYYKGSFVNGAINGQGIWHDGESKYAFGNWQNDELKEGLLIIKNQYIFYGPIADFHPGGYGVLSCLYSNVQSNFSYFEGIFGEDGNPKDGNTTYKDGRRLEGIPMTDEQLVQYDKQLKQQLLIESQQLQQQQNQNITSQEMSQTQFESQEDASYQESQISQNQKKQDTSNASQQQQDQQNAKKQSQQKIESQKQIDQENQEIKQNV